jgi:hypothetical protein
MDTHPAAAGSHLFLVRLWPAAPGDGPGWHGKVQHVVSGEARYFDDWATLINLLLAGLPALTADPVAPATGADGVEPL